MTTFKKRPTSKRRGLVVGAVCVLAASLSLVAASSASANLAGSSFEGGDGNLVHTGTNTDWDNVPALNSGIDKASGSGDNAFGQGTKEDNSAVTVVDGSIPPNKNDLSRFYEASSLGANGHTYLDLAWERLVNIGNANLDFEINHAVTTGFTGTTTGLVTLNRTAGDLLVSYDFGGSGTPTLGLNTWLTAAHHDTVGNCFSANSLPCWGNHVTLNGTDSEGAVNTGPVTDPIAPNVGRTLGVGLFGEAAIDLTAAGVFPAGTCTAFGSAFVKSRSASSFGAELKDFIAPIPVNISNCGSITIHKVTENGDSSFGYTTTGTLTPSTFSLSNGDAQIYSDQTAGSYSVTENLTAPQTGAGWTLKSLVCGTVSGSGTSVNISGATVSITLAGGGTVDCTYTNHTRLSPTIATTLSTSTTSIGTPVNDSSTLSGATSDVGGTVTYTVYTNSTCTAGARAAGTKTLVGGLVPDSNALSFSNAGTFYWQAVYSGDANNNSATSLCTDEQVVVNPNSPTIGTTLSKTTANIGDLVHDSSALSGATSDVSGTVTYTVYTNSTCTAGARAAGTKTLVGGLVPDSNALSFSNAGTFYWQAVYNGDANNNTATSLCTDEQVVVNPNSPTIGTTLSKTTANIGDLVHDSSALSGATSDVSGTVTYTVYTNSTCTAGARAAGTKTLVGGLVPDSNALSFSNAGTFYWQAVYNGDANNNTATSVCTDEVLVIGKNHPGVSTAQHLIPNDTFTLSGATSGAGGTITFRLYAPLDTTCTGAVQYSQTVNVSGNGNYDTTNTTFVASTEGTWRWESSYTGDANNLTAVSSCGTERFTIANS